ADRGKVQIAAVGADYDRVATKSFNAIHAVVERKLMDVTPGPAQGKDGMLFRLFRVPPAGADAVQKVVAHVAVLKIVAVDSGKRTIARWRDAGAAVGKIVDGDAHERGVAGRDFSSPHAITRRLRAHQHVQIAIFTLQKRKLVDRAAGDLQSRGRRSI